LEREAITPSENLSESAFGAEPQTTSQTPQEGRVPIGELYLLHFPEVARFKEMLKRRLVWHESHATTTTRKGMTKPIFMKTSLTSL
jgi:hypothetical protein